MCGIYKITNKINQKAYIGQSIDIQRRWRVHKNYPKNTKYPLYLAFEKYGLNNFTFEVIEECDCQELDDKEIYYIKIFNTYYNGYNQTTGGQGSSNSVLKLSCEDIICIYDLLKNSSFLQNEIAKMFNVGEDTISEINQGKTRRLDTEQYPIRNNNHKYFCIDCGILLKQKAVRCQQCNSLQQRKITRPSREELKNLIRTLPFTTIALQFGVSDNSIRKWCESYKLPSKSRIIKTYSDQDWINV